ncbi:universal stress protein [Aquisalimonas sp.]|uniref:universal stress protein n=1 Tax=Aquisalimonas sp. TaxID=1872621 RepID=UPI0025C219FF|nr:universal stress protein [Aquisalimonas sp.]
MAEREFTLIVAVDGSDQACKAAERAGELAELLQAPLHLLYVMPPRPAELGDVPANRTQDTDADLAAQRKAASEALAAARRSLPPGVRDEASPDVLEDIAHHGDPVRVIVEQGDNTPNAMVVMGARGQGGLKKLLLGSISDAVVHRAHFPVVIVHSEEHPANHPGLRQVLLPVDGSESSDAAARMAGQVARAAGATVHILFASPKPPAELTAAGKTGGGAARETASMAQSETALAQRKAHNAFQRAREHLGRVEGDVIEHQLHGRDPASAILDYAQAQTEPGVLVIGRRSMGRLREFLTGSVSHSVINQVCCPVIVVS